MAIYTNIYGIKSQMIIDALVGNDYDLAKKPANVLTATEIIDAPKAKILWRRHETELTIDVSDNLHSMDGTAMHYVLEKSNKIAKRERLSEERFFIDLGPLPFVEKPVVYTLPLDVNVVDADWYDPENIYVAFKIDNYELDAKALEDTKRCSVWEVIFGVKESRIQQLNIEKFGMELLRFPVETLRVCMLLKDWTSKDLKNAERKAAEFNKPCEYPPIPYKEIEIGVWDNETTYQFITERVMLHLNASKTEDDQIPVCSDEERWYRGESFAIVKDGLKTAKRVIKAGDYDSSEAAERAAKAALNEFRVQYPKDAAKFSIEHRPGVDTRCNGDKVYCPQRTFCNYWREQYAGNVVGALEEQY